MCRMQNDGYFVSASMLYFGPAVIIKSLSCISIAQRQYGIVMV